MSKKIKAKSNSSAKSGKVNQFKVSPLIVVIAIVEVILLIGAVSYAWFVIADNNQIDSGVITVAPDSGLRIDFKDADKNNYINLWNYLHDFAFEPATSVDGRNIYFPTTGTFNNTRTNDIVFREGTVNDVNTKYISVDFSLTNTANTDAKVYLDNNSTFNISSKKDDTTGRALRIAFYQNDNKSGDVSSNILQSFSSNSDVVTVYFNDNLGWAKGGHIPKIHIWKSSSDTYTTWPGYEMKHISGDLYYFSFENKKGNTSNYYSNVLFTDGTGEEGTAANNQTVDLTLQNGYIYTPDGTKTGAKYKADSEAYSSLIDTSGKGYAVIAPGVSTGFQRPYAPVTTINNESGKPTKIVPAYANSIDDYFTIETDNLFTIPQGETQSLSMIIWLEGTDPNCTEDYYAGDSIDLNLVFSTSTNDAANNYTFKFFDETKENWLDDEITENGLTFKPVMQLYDLDKKRGYLMNLTGKTWSVSAPQDIIKNKDRLEFRRVNPNDESEIWNYWDASELKPQDIFDYVHDRDDANPNLTVCFTAFADGSPTPEMMESYPSANVPEHSCGGLWGKHETTKFTFVDGTNKVGGERYLIKSGGMMTINYTYHFANGKAQHIEYKASSPEYGGQFFRFIVPKTIVKTISAAENASYSNINDGSSSSSTPVYKFKHYTGFNSKYAANIRNKNTGIAYKDTYTANQTMDGTCAMTTGDMTYFGVELCYIQGGSNNWSNGERTNMFADGATLQVRFYNESNNEIQKVTLKANSNNSNWEETDYRGFACVVPANRYKWGVWRTNQDGTTTYNSPERDQQGYYSSYRLYTAYKMSNGTIYWKTNSVLWPQYGDY